MESKIDIDSIRAEDFAFQFRETECTLGTNTATYVYIVGSSPCGVPGPEIISITAPDIAGCRTDC